MQVHEAVRHAGHVAGAQDPTPAMETLQAARLLTGLDFLGLPGRPISLAKEGGEGQGELSREDVSGRGFKQMQRKSNTAAVQRDSPSMKRLVSSRGQSLSAHASPANKVRFISLI